MGFSPAWLFARKVEMLSANNDRNCIRNAFQKTAIWRINEECYVMNTEKTEAIMSGSSKTSNPESRAAEAKPKKLQVELSGALHEIVKKILECTSLKSQRDVVYNALSVFNWAVEQRRLGRNIGAYFAT